jgi:hypothetical protein
MKTGKWNRLGLQLIAVTLSFGWLGEFHVLFRQHQAPKLLQDDFDAV